MRGIIQRCRDCNSPAKYLISAQVADPVACGVHVKKYQRMGIQTVLVKWIDLPDKPKGEK